MRYIGRYVATGDTDDSMLPAFKIEGVELSKISVNSRPGYKLPQVIVETFTVPVKKTTSAASGIVTVAAVATVI